MDDYTTNSPIIPIGLLPRERDLLANLLTGEIERLDNKLETTALDSTDREYTQLLRAMYSKLHDKLSGK